jgi:crotonobetainyl-CoA:carnitine CoA-transferase CaiB-like acyl-CoA transferase
VAIAVTNDEEWRQLAQLVGGSELSADPRFATLAGRLENEDQLDDLISGWTVDKKAYDLCHLLQREGVPASPVMGGPDLLADPHYAARGTFVRVNHEQVGEKTYPGIPWKMSATPGKARWASPTLGQHNRQIYGELLAMPTDDITALEEQGIIGTIPTGSRII